MPSHARRISPYAYPLTEVLTFFCERQHDQKEEIGSEKKFDGGIRIELGESGWYDFAYGQTPFDVPRLTRDGL
jgi:hypothetical protein